MQQRSVTIVSASVADKLEPVPLSPVKFCNSNRTYLIVFFLIFFLKPIGNIPTEGIKNNNINNRIYI